MYVSYQDFYNRVMLPLVLCVATINYWNHMEASVEVEFIISNMFLIVHHTRQCLYSRSQF